MQYAQKVMDYILRFHSEMEYLGLQAYKSAEEKERKIKALTAYSCKVSATKPGSDEVVGGCDRVMQVVKLRSAKDLLLPTTKTQITFSRISHFFLYPSLLFFFSVKVTDRLVTSACHQIE